MNITQLVEPYSRWRWKRIFNALHRDISKSGEVPPPSKITFELTDRCNLNCRMCFREKKRNELSPKEIKKVLDNIGPIKEISLIGGEIFIRNDIFEILDLLNGISIVFHTNGTLLDEEKIDKLRGYKFRRIGFSIDGMRSLNNKIRGSDSAFERTVWAIRSMNGFPTAVNTVVMKDNLDQLGGVLDLASNLNAREYRIEPEMFSTAEDVRVSEEILGTGHCIATKIKKSDAYDYPLQRFQEIKAGLKRQAANNGIKFTVAPRVADIDEEEFFSGRIREKKLFCKHLLVPRIDPNGNVIFCHLIRKRFGNLLDTPLKEIWNSTELREIRIKLLENNLLPLCKRCCRLRSI
ncbi:MAG: radical SAM protein [Candidatus Hydrothermarchaeales archaeon]